MDRQSNLLAGPNLIHCDTGLVMGERLDKGQSLVLHVGLGNPNFTLNNYFNIPSIYYL